MNYRFCECVITSVLSGVSDPDFLLSVQVMLVSGWLGVGFNECS